MPLNNLTKQRRVFTALSNTEKKAIRNTYLKLFNNIGLTRMNNTRKNTRYPRNSFILFKAGLQHFVLNQRGYLFKYNYKNGKVGDILLKFNPVRLPRDLQSPRSI